MMLAKAGCVAATLVALVTGAASAETVGRLGTQSNAEAGTYLTDGRGHALYTFSQDDKDAKKPESACRDACATMWPPAQANGDVEASGKVASGKVSTFDRDDGGSQIAYDGKPLYYYAPDKPGEAAGEGVKAFGGTWHLAKAGGDSQHKPQQAALFDGLKLKNPECVRYDAEHHRYLISNINGKMREADNNGFITVVGEDGTTTLKWIEGGKNGVTLNAPKGMALSGGKLYLADIDHMRIFDAGTGKPLGAVEIKKAKFLNDLAVADDGTVYITDSGTAGIPGAVYRIDPDHNVKMLAEGPDLKRPNGIDFAPNGDLVVVTYASNQIMTMSRDGKVKNRKELSAGELDGLVVEKDGTMYVTSWKARHVVRIPAGGGKASVVLTGTPQPAAMDVDTDHGLLLVPQVSENAVAAAPLPSKEKTAATKE